MFTERECEEIRAGCDAKIACRLDREPVSESELMETAWWEGYQACLKKLDRHAGPNVLNWYRTVKG